MAANGRIVEEFFGENLSRLAVLLTQQGRIHLLYRAGEVAEVESEFAETLTRVEFLDKQAEVLLGSYAEGAGSGRALIGTQLYSIARYTLDFVDYAYSLKRSADQSREDAADIRSQYGLPDPTDPGTKSSPAPALSGDIGPVRQAQADAARADRVSQALDQERHLLTAAALSVVRQRLAEAQTALLRQARTRSTRVYIIGISAGLVIMLAVAVAVGLTLTGLGSGANSRQLNIGIAIGAGTVGAFISVLTRLVNSSLTLDSSASRVELLIAGTSRAFIGGVFGAVIFVFGASGLVSLPTGSAPGVEGYLWAAFGFLAGFSERWVQDILGTVANSSGGASRKKKRRRTP
jgi:hypothetical protein